MRPSSIPRAAVVGGVLAAVAAAAAVAAPPAGAHAAYARSDPADESTVARPPGEVWAEFTEPVVEDSRLEVFDACGNRVDGGDSRAAGYRVTVSMTGAHAGTYTVEWAVVSTLDGHPTSGEFTFTSAGGRPCPAPAGAGDEPTIDKASREDASSGSGGKDDRVRVASGASDGRPQDGGRRDRSSARVRDNRIAEGERSDAAVPDSAERDDRDDSDVPLGGLVAALIIAAAIGAAGGLVYAGIMGPKD